MGSRRRNPKGGKALQRRRWREANLTNLSTNASTIGFSAAGAAERPCRAGVLTCTTASCGTNVEGDWDEVMSALRRCHQVVHEMGAPRVSTTVKLGTRIDREQTMREKVESVDAIRGSEGPDSGGPASEG